MKVSKTKMPARSLSDSEMECSVVPEDCGLPRKASCPVIHSHRHNLKNRFELRKTLGQGTYGKVKLAIEKTTGKQVCLGLSMIFFVCFFLRKGPPLSDQTVAEFG